MNISTSIRLFLICSTTVLALSCGETDEPGIEEAEPVKISVNTGVYFTFPEEISNFYFKESFYGDTAAIGFAVGAQNVYKYSPNNKSIWNWEVVGKMPKRTDFYVYRAVHAINDQIVLVDGYRSEDGGTTWDLVGGFKGKYFFIDEMVGFSYRGYAYSGNTGSGPGPEPIDNESISRTDDGGKTWQTIEIYRFIAGSDHHTFETIILDMAEIDGKIVATGDHTLYSEDLGITWTHIPSANGRSYGIGKSSAGITVLSGHNYSTDEISANMQWHQYLADSLPATVDNCFTCNRGSGEGAIIVWKNTVAHFGLTHHKYSINGGVRWYKANSGNGSGVTHSESLTPYSFDPTINRSPVDGTLYHLKNNTDRTTSIYRLEIKPE